MSGTFAASIKRLADAVYSSIGHAAGVFEAEMPAVAIEESRKAISCYLEMLAKQTGSLDKISVTVRPEDNTPDRMKDGYLTLTISGPASLMRKLPDPQREAPCLQRLA